MAKTAVKHMQVDSVAEKDKGKPYLTANIDRAIVMTQYDLRGFAHPLGLRIQHKHPKYLDATIGNFMSFASHAGERERTDPKHVDYFDSPFKDYLAMCRRLAECCDESEKEAIQLVIGEFIRQHADMTAEVASGKIDDRGGYLKPLTKHNRMGKAVIALAMAFDVKLPTAKKRKKK